VWTMVSVGVCDIYHGRGGRVEEEGRGRECVYVVSHIYIFVYTHRQAHEYFFLHTHARSEYNEAV